MNRASILFILMVASVATLGQTIKVSFTGTGAANRIDSVKATNLTTNQSVTLPGNQTLVLTSSNGIPTVATSTYTGIVYPNPFPGKTTFTAAFQRPQKVYVNITNLLGQAVAQTNALVQPGENEFALSIMNKGLYVVTLTTDQGNTGYKIICAETTESENKIEYLGSGTNNQNNQNNQNNHNISSAAGLKTSQTSYTLGYTSGEIILYKCYSGIFTTIVTDTPIESKNYEVEFAECTDSDGRNYSIVKIGYQTWMAENLAYLPSVNPTTVGSMPVDPHFYVYDYQGSNVTEAKKQPNYSTYGVLYNWPAATGDSSSTSVPSRVKGICPSGWHLPSDDEWTNLIDHLGKTAGGKMKEAGTGHWSSPNAGATNSSGFTALPGGFGDPWFGCQLIGTSVAFWSTTPGALGAYCRGMNSESEVTAEFSQSYSTHKHIGISVRCLMDGPTKPRATFIIDPPRGQTSMTFQFDASGSIDAETALENIEVRWDWNGDSIWDTNFGKAKGNSYKYSNPGTYPVILEVRDEDGFVDRDTQTVVVIDGTFTDDRDGSEYDFLNIGTQTWMIDNLAYLPSVSPSSAESLTSPYYYVYGNEDTIVSSAKAAENYNTYGVLYNWEAAKNACPEGWRLPSDEDWTKLTEFLGTQAGDKMREFGTTHWLPPNGGAINSSGFTALPGGHRFKYGQGRGFRDQGGSAHFWTGTEIDASFALKWGLGYNSHDAGRAGHYEKWFGFSVRCVKGKVPIASFTINPHSGTISTTFQFDASGSTDFETVTADLEIRWDWNGDSIWDTTFDKVKTISHQFASPGSYTVILQVKDADELVGNAANTVSVGEGILTDNRDGRDYAYKAIGTQTWMIENLAWLPAVSPSSMGSATSPLYYVYGYEGVSSGDAKASANFTTYGVLYNWEAAKTACPSGWHLPSEEDWNILTDYLGTNAGGKMKEYGTWHWSKPNTGATDSCGFTSLPGGYRFNTGGFRNINFNNHLWSSSANAELYAWYRNLSYNSNGIDRRSGSRGNGLSVRCLKD